MSRILNEKTRRKESLTTVELIQTHLIHERQEITAVNKIIILSSIPAVDNSLPQTGHTNITGIFHECD